MLYRRTHTFLLDELIFTKMSTLTLNLSPGYVYDGSQDLRLRCQDVCNMGFCSDGFECHQTENGAICVDPKNPPENHETVIQLSLGLMLFFLL